MQTSKQVDFDTIFVASVVEGQHDREWPFNPPTHHPITRDFCKIKKYGDSWSPIESLSSKMLR